MNRPPATRPPAVEPSRQPSEGWHCLHIYYQFKRDVLGRMDADAVRVGSDQLIRSLDPSGEHATTRLQTSVVSGHRADFSLMLMDPDPLNVDRVHQSVIGGPLGVAIESTYSFVSVSEVSEYVMSVEQYAAKLIKDGEEDGSPSYQAKLRGYEQRLPIMNQERLTPEFPEWPVTCFYPMNKKRKVGENWFTLPISKRQELMSEHARSGMKYMGKVKQLITVGVGLDDWEWGVTLWAANPEFLTDIVYTMRFDEASARYAEFGPFYTSYPMTAEEMLRHCQVLR